MSSLTTTNEVSKRKQSNSPQNLGLFALALKSILHFRQMLWPISAGVAAATAIIVGALVVGDSVRGTLRSTALDRLGKIQQLLIAPRFFSEQVIEKWADQESFPKEQVGKPIGLMLFPRSGVEAHRTKLKRTATGTLVFGIRDSFWSLSDFSLDATRNQLHVESLGENEIIINQALADDLEVKVDDVITLRLPSQSAVPADSPLGKRETETVNLPNLRVKQILPNRSLARFDLQINQRPPKNAFVSLTAIQEALSRPGQINATVLPVPSDERAEHKSASVENGKKVSKQLIESLPIELSDLGYKLESVKRVFPDSRRGESSEEVEEQTVFEYLSLSTDQFLIPSNSVDAIRSLWPQNKSTPILSYLANTITKETEQQAELRLIRRRQFGRDGRDPVVSYSTIAAVEPDLFLPEKSFGLYDASLKHFEQLADNEVIINSWLSEQLRASVGDPITVRYFQPETKSGKEVEVGFTFTVAAIVPITQPESGYRRNKLSRYTELPTRFNDPSLTPEVPGITDQDSMSDWDLPFKLTYTVRKEDDSYWTDHRLTPKLFLTLEKGRELFGSRFGNVSSIRLEKDIDTDLDVIRSKIFAAVRPLMNELGWNVQPIRDGQIAASKGTTPFDLLFLSLSMFVIIAALLLVSLLFRLSFERRATHWGLLSSIGWNNRKIQKLLTREGLVLSSVGAVVGIPLGILYAFGVLYMLKTLWVGAVGIPFIDFYVGWPSLVIGAVSGTSAALITIWHASRMIRKSNAIDLLRGRVGSTRLKRSNLKLLWLALAAILGIATIAMSVFGIYLRGPAAGGAFLGGGMLGLSALLLYAWTRLSLQANSEDDSMDLSLLVLAATAVQRNPLRSVFAIGLIAIATLLILSISLFNVAPSNEGTGGFTFIAQSTMPIMKDLGDPVYQREVGGARTNILNAGTFMAMRVRDGDDAGCSNLYQASQPRVLGISPRLPLFDAGQFQKNSFAWAGQVQHRDDTERLSRWYLLDREGDGTAEHPLPVILDQNTALWALHLTGQPGEVFSYDYDGRKLHFQTVALLQNTILQGSLILSEKNFTKTFPNIMGYRQWLVHVSRADYESSIVAVLENGWADDGMDLERTDTILKSLLAVQNTYLKAFQSLGALGLLLGTFGLAVVQIRSIMERRKELGLFRAIGFTKWRIATVLMIECLTLLMSGLAIGVVASLIALLPTVLAGNLKPAVWEPAIMLVVVAFFGVLASLVAIHQAMKVPMLEAIRNDA